MRYVPLEKFIAAREKLSLRVSLIYSVPIAILLFLLTASTGFFEGILFGLIAGGIVFVLIFFSRKFTHKAVEKKRKKLAPDTPHFDVTLKGEMGVLSILDDRLHYIGLTPGAATKEYSVVIDEHTFLSVGKIKQKAFRNFKYGDLEECFLMAKIMPSGLPVQFVFYDIDGLFDIVTKRIVEVDKFQEE